MPSLNNLRVAVIATDGFEESELTKPVEALKEAGAQVDIISTKSGQIQAFQHLTPSIKIDVTRTLDQVQPEKYDAMVLPGGAVNADMLRVEPKVQSFIQSFQQA